MTIIFIHDFRQKVGYNDDGVMEMIIVIYGEESFLMNQKLESLKKDFACNEENMNFSIYRGDEDSIEAVYEDLITPPFFTDKKMVV